MSAPTFPIALDKTVTNVAATSGLFTLTLSDTNGILIGSRIDVGGFNTASWNTMNEEVTAVNHTAKTIQYTHGNFTVPSQETWAQVHVEVTWITTADVENWLGFTTAGADATFLATCTDAANDRCWQYRSRARYKDHPNVSPSSDVRLGTIMYAAQLYKQRGAVDGFASFDQQGFAVAPGQSLGQILALLGCKRPGVG